MTRAAALVLVWLLASSAGPESWIRVLAVSAPRRLSEEGKASIRQFTTEDYEKAVRRTLEVLPPEQREALRRTLESSPPVTIDPHAQAAVAEATHYEIVLENTSIDRFVRRVRLEVRYLRADGTEAGSGSTELSVSLRPHSPERVRYHCPDERCVSAAALDVVAAVPLAVSGYEDRWIRFRDRTWHVVDRWRSERRVSIYPFSPGYYDGRFFQSRVFAHGRFDVEGSTTERFFKLLLTVPASKPYPEDDSRWMMAAGVIVEAGRPVKPGFFSDFWSATRLLNAAATAELRAGEFVQIDHVEASGRDLGFHIVPVCQPRRGRLNSWIYFRLGKAAIKARDSEAAEAAVRQGLVPVPAADVAQVCGPRTGIPIVHLTPKSDEGAVASVLGEPEVRREEAAGGEELVYGRMRLRFTDGAFAGVTFR